LESKKKSLRVATAEMVSASTSSPFTTSSLSVQNNNNVHNENGCTTQSFGAITASNFTGLKDKNIPVHTLLLGTHPSVISFEKDQYYANPLKYVNV